MSRLYRYFAETEGGKLAIGSLRASHTRQVEELLKKKYTQTHFIEKLPSMGLKQMFGPRMGLVERIMFVKNLYVMLKAGVPLDEAFNLMNLQSASKGAKKIGQSVVTKIRGGKTLAMALSGFDHVFNPFFINMIYVGEKSGTLDANLQYLAKELEHSLELRRKIRSAALYPVIILTMTFILGAMMIRFVLPQLIKVFKSISLDLPLQTRLFLNLAEFIQNYSTLITVSIIAVVIVMRIALAALPDFNLWYSRLLLKIPVIGAMIASYNLAQLTRTLGVLLQTGTPLIDALDITAKASGNLYYKVELIKAKKSVSQGQSLGESLTHLQFNPLVAQLISMGEKSGNLEGNLLYLSEFYNHRIDYMTKDLPTVLEPVLLIIVGLSVAFVAISILSPIYDFTSSIGK